MTQIELGFPIVTTQVRLRGITLMQPWATLLVLNEKRLETRSRNFPRKFRGRTVIHASKRFPYHARQLCDLPLFKRVLGRHNIRSADELPLGQILGVSHVLDCVPTETVVKTITRQERRFGNYTKGRLAINMAFAIALERPIACKGALGYWRVPPDIERAVLEQIEHEETIICPECRRVQQAIVEHTQPFFTYVHHCECGYTITESEWERAEKTPPPEARRLLNSSELNRCGTASGS